MRTTAHLPGTPTWVDVGSADIEATSAFYGDLFGWKALESSDDFGGYVRYELDGAGVAGAYPLMAEGQPVSWVTYFAVASADAAALRVRDAGGQVIAEPMDVGDLGRMAIFVDPTGATFGVWQAGTFGGAGIVDEPGTLSWNEVETPDPAGAGDFYQAVLGVTRKANETLGVPYTELVVNDHSVAGVMQSNGQPRWHVHFAVSDCDAMCERAQQLGATVVTPPTDIPIARYATVTDPQGAEFSLLQMND